MNLSKLSITNLAKIEAMFEIISDDINYGGNLRPIYRVFAYEVSKVANSKEKHYLKIFTVLLDKYYSCNLETKTDKSICYTRAYRAFVRLYNKVMLYIRNLEINPKFMVLNAEYKNGNTEWLATHTFDLNLIND